MIVNKIEEQITAIVSGGSLPDQKLQDLNDLLGVLNPHDNRLEIIKICEASINIANALNRNETLAQLYLIKAKNEISLAGTIIHEMVNLKMSLDWFNFSLEKDRQRYRTLNRKLQRIWKETQENIDLGFENLKSKPFVGVAAYCYQTRGEIYGAFYLDLKLLYTKSKVPLAARIANYRITRWLDLDDWLTMDRQHAKKINSIKRDCLRFFKESVRLFKRENNHEFLANCYVNFAFEYHSFNSPIRCKFYQYKAEWLMKKHNLISNPTLAINYKILAEQPLIGSTRDLENN